MPRFAGKFKGAKVIDASRKLRRGRMTLKSVSNMLERLKAAQHAIAKQRVRKKVRFLNRAQALGSSKAAALAEWNRLYEPAFNEAFALFREELNRLNVEKANQQNIA